MALVKTDVSEERIAGCSTELPLLCISYVAVCPPEPPVTWKCARDPLVARWFIPYTRGFLQDVTAVIKRGTGL
jgi:hypothetical protein